MARRLKLNNTRNTLSSRIVVAGLALMMTVPAYAYIDPGTGSLIVQGVIGAIAAAGITLKLYWHKLKIFFFKDKQDAIESTDAPDNEQKE